MRPVRIIGRARVMSDLVSVTISESVGKANCDFSSGSAFGFSAKSSFEGLASHMNSKMRWVRKCFCSDFIVTEMGLFEFFMMNNNNNNNNKWFKTNGDDQTNHPNLFHMPADFACSS